MSSTRLEKVASPLEFVLTLVVEPVKEPGPVTLIVTATPLSATALP